MAPTLTAAVQQQTRVLLTLNWPGIQTATIQRLDPDGVLRNVRNAEPVTCLGSCAVFDHEAPLDQAVTWQAYVSAGGQIAFDTFTRTVASGWGSTDSGLAYTLLGTASEFAVGSGTGQQILHVVNATHESRLALGVADMDVRADIDNDLGLAPAAGSLQAFVNCRVNNSGNNMYRLALTYQTSGSVTAGLSKIVGGTPTTLGSAVTL